MTLSRKTLQGHFTESIQDRHLWSVDMDISMDIHGKSVDMNMDMDMDE